MFIDDGRMLAISDRIARATFAGGLATGAYFAVFGLALMVEIGPNAIAVALFMGIIAWLFGTVAVFLGVLLFGLPISLLLHRLGVEGIGVYAIAGAVGGFLLPSVIAAATGSGFEASLLIAWVLPGMVSGTVAAVYWSKGRDERLANGSETDPVAPNRIHDERMLR
ncbi:MAG: hypothetical protein ABIT10_12990 [Alteraurantiacibacter sp.]